MKSIWSLFKVCIIAIIMPATLQTKDNKSLQVLIDGSNKFAFELYQKLAKASGTGNIIVSPISAQIVLSLASNGGKGGTADEIAKALHFPENKTEMLEGYTSLITGLESPVLELATKMFTEQTLKLNPEFQSIATKYYLSAAEGVDFIGNPGAAVTKINGWAEEKTHDKIKGLVSTDTITSDSRLVLVNAIYFKANWSIEFNPNLTHDAPFFVTPTNSVTVKMMTMNDKKFKYMYSEKLSAKIVELPYAKNEFSMIIVLPEAVDGLAVVESKLAQINLSEELQGLQEASVNLKMPRFKIEETMELNEVLQELGIKTAFSDLADFSGLTTSEPLKISKVIQKAFIEVNEAGTEAAAATVGVIRMRRSLGPQTPRVEFHCDRPFGFIIIEAATGSVVFASRIVQLTQDSPVSTSHSTVHHQEL